MTKELIIREPIIFFQQEIQFRPQISLKLCYDRQIYKFNDFNWDELCQRWQCKSELKIPWPNCNKVQLQVYFEQECKVGEVLGQGSLNMPLVLAYLDRQIKIALMYDGVYVGSLYCQISNTGENDNQMAKNFLYIHKIEIVILEDISENLTIRVLKNNQQVYQKDFNMPHKSKSLFPNIKIPVKMSDVFTLSIQSRHLFVKDVKFLTESIKRGKTSNYEVWLRNKLKNKMGEMKVEYFLQNIFLQNQRQVFARNGIYPHKIEKPVVQISQQQKDKLRRSVIIRCLEEADKRILKINQSMRKLVKKVQAKEDVSKGELLKERKQTLKKAPNYQFKDAIKENRAPAFKTSVHN